MNRNYIKRGAGFLKRNGIRASIYKAAERLSRDKDEAAYDSVAKSSIADDETIKMQRDHKFERAYKISILVPLYETDIEMLKKMLVSVGEQTYTNWELILADASKTDERRNTVRDFCEEYYLKCSDSFGIIHDKVKYIYLEKNLGISGNTNEALANATGDYVALLDHDDELVSTALFDVIWNINEQEFTKEGGLVKLNRIMAVYSDEDKVSEDNSRYFDYHKKPDFDPVLLCSNNYICHLFVVDTNLAKSVGGFDSGYDGSQDHDFILKCTEGLKKDQIIHIPKVLYHWRSSGKSTAENPSAKLYAYKSGKKAVRDFLTRKGIKANVKDTRHLGFYKIVYENFNKSVVSFSKEKADEMSELQMSMFPQEFYMIVSEELKPLNALYIEKMMGPMRHDFVGAVTGKIIGKNGKIESAGFDITDGKRVPRFEGLNRHFSGYMHRADLQQLVDDFSRDAVLVRKDAIKSFKPEVVLKDEYSVYYEPEAIFKRRTI